MVAVAAAAGLLAGCGSSAPAPAADPKTPPGTPDAKPSRSVVTPAVHHRPRPLTLLPPSCAPGQLRLGPATSDGGGGEGYQVWSIHLAHGRPCTLWGAPDLRFRDSSGATLPFSVTQRWVGSERRGPVLVDSRHSPAFPVAKYRCDTTVNPPVVASVTATMPNGAGTLTGTVARTAARLAYCPRDDGDQRVHVGTIGSWQLTRQTPPTRVAVSVHSSFLPPRTPSWGRADLNGDGHADTVVVRPSGQVTARVGHRVLHTRVGGRPTDRLQGFADLAGDGRPEALVAATSVGCDGGYRLCDSRPTVLTFRAVRLRVLRFPNGEPDFDLGVGRLTTAWTCGADGLVGTRLLLTGLTGYRLTRTTYRASGLAVRAVGRSVSTGHLSEIDFEQVTATHCAGLSALGWAWEHPQPSRPMT